MQRLLAHPITLLICTALTIVFFVSLDKNAQTVKTSAKTLQALESQHQQLESEVNKLQEQVDVAQTAVAKEKIIRNELLLQKEGEFVVQLPAEAAAPTVQQQPATTPAPWQAWQEILL